jgi:hypothetical protein
VIEFDWVSRTFAIWHRYDETTKTELFSTALVLENDLTIFDPIALPKKSRQEFESFGTIGRIVISNANHMRATEVFAEPESAVVFVPAELSAQFSNSHTLSDGLELGPVRATQIEGAAAGEFAFYHPDNGGTLIMGDALINFDPHGFTLLPKKYCIDQKQMTRSLRKLLDFDFTRIFFAHGNPIMLRGHDRLAALLDT